MNQPEEWQHVVIDYANVQSAKELVRWAVETFNMPTDGAETASRAFIMALFTHIGSQKYGYEVLELNYHLQTNEVRSLLDGQDGWKHILGFHLHRDYGVDVRFVQYTGQGHKLNSWFSKLGANFRRFTQIKLRN